MSGPSDRKAAATRRLLELFTHDQLRAVAEALTFGVLIGENSEPGAQVHLPLRGLTDEQWDAFMEYSRAMREDVNG